MRDHRRAPLLAAASAAAALVLTGCGLFGGEDEPAPEETAQQSSAEATATTASPDATDEATAETSSAAPSPSATASSSATAGGGAGEAPADLSNSSVMGALNGQVVGGVELNALPVSLMEASGQDIPALLEESLGVVAVDPASCADPVQGSFMGGIMQSNMADGVVGVDTGGSVIITVHSFDSVQDAEADLQGFRDEVDDCSEATMSVDGESLPVELSDEDLTVEGAETAIRTRLNASGAGESIAVHSGRMVYGNSVVSVLSSGEYQGEQADYEALLTEVAQLLQGA
ncbi:hypothetical protein FCK90_11365 [Kocuria coralli]|uniref:Sensor domain-containing protein n=1 Tax=Kocuria coralli TaxID=1461025 RepID=A0A5J5KVH6_9MICC|nr:hypothetical protein [Kocuria coralli]KAA9393584.1 hypothetical protein FCK90_11365 [Kocuria coralli]